MKQPMIEINRASEQLIKFLLDEGILYVDEEGIHAIEIAPTDR